MVPVMPTKTVKATQATTSRWSIAIRMALFNGGNGVNIISIKLTLPA
jgi:hypothetical protein